MREKMEKIAKVQKDRDGMGTTPSSGLSVFENVVDKGKSLLGAVASVSADATGAVLPLVEGNSGVYAVVVDEVAVEEKQSVEAERVKAQASAESMASRRAMWAVQSKANIVDGTVGYF